MAGTEKTKKTKAKRSTAEKKEEAKATTKKAAGSKTKAKTKAAPKKQQPAKKQAENAPVLSDELIRNIQDQMHDMLEDTGKMKKNASAAKRVRKASTNLEKDFKILRKASIEHHRKE
jgi:trimethylamine:corrinoid methyltransferase-like protein